MLASPLTTVVDSSAGLPNCSWRAGTRLPSTYYCRNTFVHTTNSLVDAGICKGCHQLARRVLLPRPPLEDPLEPRKPPENRPWEYISLERLVADVRQLVSQLPRGLAGIAAIPRSGMMAAAQIALTLHLPLWEVSRQQGLRPVGHGGRLDDYVSTEGPLLVVDDAVYSGTAVDAARTTLRAALPNGQCLFAALYPVPEAVHALDFHVHPLAHPQLFEWNLLNSANTLSFAVDFDGVLCADWPGGDEEGEAYQTFVRCAPPRWIPRYEAVPLIVTGRLEKHRAASEAWLQRQGAKFGRLVMGPWESTQQRDQNGDASLLKGKAYADSHCWLFVESDELQSELIFRTAKKPVLCATTGRIFQ